MRVAVVGVAIIAPGLGNWSQAAKVLARGEALDPGAGAVPPATCLPPTERRRVGQSVKVAIALAEQLFASPGAPPASQTQTLFTSSGGDGENCHILCEALEAAEPLLSPTRFTNSVHNAPAGYWSIAAKCQKPSTSLCAFDGSFAAGLVEASINALHDNEPVALIAYDVAYPEPLAAKRALLPAAGVALLLAPVSMTHESANAAGVLGVLEIGGYPNGIASTITHTAVDAELERLRLGSPALRALPLLHALAIGGVSPLLIGGNDNQVLPVKVVPGGASA